MYFLILAQAVSSTPEGKNPARRHELGIYVLLKKKTTKPKPTQNQLNTRYFKRECMLHVQGDKAKHLFGVKLKTHNLCCEASLFPWEIGNNLV